MTVSTSVQLYNVSAGQDTSFSIILPFSKSILKKHVKQVCFCSFAVDSGTLMVFVSSRKLPRALLIIIIVQYTPYYSDY